MRPPVRRFRLGARLTPAVTWLIGVSVAVFLLFIFSGPAVRATLSGHLVLTPASLLRLELWKLVTTAFVTANGVAFLIDLLVLWFFMPFLERAWGLRRFLVFAAVTTLAGNLVAALVGVALGGAALAAPIAGLAPFIYGGIVGYGVAFANQPLQFFGVLPMKGKTLAIGMAAVIVLAAVVNQDWVAGSGHVAAMVAAVLLTSSRITPRLWLLQLRRARIRRRYRVLDGGKDHKWLN